MKHSWLNPSLFKADKTWSKLIYAFIPIEDLQKKINMRRRISNRRSSNQKKALSVWF